MPMIREKAVRNESLDRSNARDLEQVVRLLREVDVSPVSPSSTTGCETSRSEMDRWKILHSAKNLKLKEGTRNESCGRFGKRTPFLRWRAQLYRTLSLTSPSSTTGSKQSTNITHRHLVWRIHTH